MRPVAPTAAALLREARGSARLTQRDLAERAGLAQSVISAYESGRRQPSLPTLLRLVEATAHDLVIALQPMPPGLDALVGPLSRAIRQHRDEVVATARECGMTNVRLFGEVACGRDDSDSTIDLLVDVDPAVEPGMTFSLAGALFLVLDAGVRVYDAARIGPSRWRDLADELVPL